MACTVVGVAVFLMEIAGTGLVVQWMVAVVLQQLGVGVVRREQVVGEDVVACGRRRRPSPCRSP